MSKYCLQINFAFFQFLTDNTLSDIIVTEEDRLSDSDFEQEEATGDLIQAEVHEISDISIFSCCTDKSMYHNIS